MTLWALLLLALPWAPGARAAGQERPIELDVRHEEYEFKSAEEEMASIMERVAHGDLPKIQFEFDDWRIIGRSMPTIEALSDLLRRNPRMKLFVTAHTCTVGKKKYNIWLSEKRAKSVKEAFVKRGIPPPSIRYRGKGYSEPVADNATPEGREKNRRVEFKLLRRWWSAIY